MERRQYFIVFNRDFGEPVLAVLHGELFLLRRRPRSNQPIANSRGLCRDPSLLSRKLSSQCSLVIIIVAAVVSVADGYDALRAAQTDAADIAIIASVIIRSRRVIAGKIQDAAIFAAQGK